MSDYDEDGYDYHDGGYDDSGYDGGYEDDVDYGHANYEEDSSDYNDNFDEDDDIDDNDDLDDDLDDYDDLDDDLDDDNDNDLDDDDDLDDDHDLDDDDDHDHDQFDCEHDPYDCDEDHEIVVVDRQQKTYDSSHDLAWLAGLAGIAAASMLPWGSGIRRRCDDPYINQLNGQIKHEQKNITDFESRRALEKDPNVAKRYRQRSDASRRRIEKYTRQILDHEKDSGANSSRSKSTKVKQILGIIGLIIFVIATVIILSLF